ncbi:MAG: hypothetical protein A2Z88_10680 [Omnitrophica WOR_2 bacterium GWA2_47_8]|nr:MAG: hypothetical protein A2Z88_10680 [Omnitrophica WOR_2 bacterium GWA2_47_8]
MTLKDKIEKIICSKFKITHLEILDKTQEHAGHAEAVKSGGKGHFALLIISPDFIEKTKLDRHREIHRALDGQLKNEIHALSIRALTPDEYAARN